MQTFDQYLVWLRLWYWKTDDLEIANLVIKYCFHLGGNCVCHCGGRRCLYYSTMHRYEREKEQDCNLSSVMNI